MKLFSVLSVFSVVTLSAQDSVRTLPDIVITATRTPLPRAAITASVTVLDGNALRARGLSTVADALRDLPEAAFVRTGSYGAQTSLFLRGGESNFTKVLVDGVAVNDPGGSFDFATLTLDDVERIEVVRGPASVLYGSDAVSGVVHVITRRRGGAEVGGDLSLRAGTYGTLDASTGVSGAAGSLHWGVTAARHASDGVYEFNNQFENLVAGARAGAAFGGTTIDLTSRYADGTYHFPTNSIGAAVDSNQFATTETGTLGLEAGHRFSSRVEARVQLGVNRLDGGTDNQPDAPGDPLSTSTRTLTRRTADARLNLALGTAMLTVGGELEGEHEQTGFESVSSFGTFTSAFDETRRNVAGYLQATHHARALALSAGARLDENQRFGTFVTARGGAAYRFAPGTRVRASAGTGFKEPTFFESFGSEFVVGNPGLSPERSVSWELGVEQSLADGAVALEAAVFIQRFSNMIEFIGAPANAGDPNYVNVAGARADGLELSADVRPSPVSRLTFRYTRLLTEVTAAGTDPTFAVGDVLVRRPGHAGSVRLFVTPLPSVDVHGGARYTGQRTDLDFSVVDFVTVFDPARVTLSEYALLDLGASWRVVRGVTLDVSVQNLLATDYEEARGFLTPGRT
ncbi:MAG: TonB-dependent receptor, partial [Gemmatimonadales bacterium]